jgi:uncharacterized protein (DUF1800 family)
VPVELTRRSAIATTLAGAGVLAVARGQGAGAAKAALTPVRDPAVHAARRLTYGATPEVVASIRSMGLSAWVDSQLDGGMDMNGLVAGLSLATVPIPGAIPTIPLTVDELQVATLARAIYADKQLFELLVEFWSNHLSVTPKPDRVGQLKVPDERDVARAHAIGTFTDMLVASAQSPAMLRYLNNAESAAPHPNENYARELLELHTVGVHGGYTQKDVVAASKALSGMSVDGVGQFTYQPSFHVTGPLKVLGWTHPNNDAAKGQDVALSLVRYLAGHPATAKHLATKLVRRFVSDDPPPRLVASAARVYLAHRTAIVPVVKHIVMSKEFAASSGQKAQRPFEFFAMAARALNAAQNPDWSANPASLLGWLDRLGQIPFEWPLPDGYPDVAPAFASTASLLARWDLAQALANNQVPEFLAYDVDTLIGTPVPTTVKGLVNRLVVRLLCHGTRGATVDALVESTGKAATTAIDAATAKAMTPALAALILSSPEAQVR